MKIACAIITQPTSLSESASLAHLRSKALPGRPTATMELDPISCIDSFDPQTSKRQYLRPYLILSFHFLLAPLPQCTSKAVAAIVLAGWQLEHASQKHDTCARQRKTSRKGTTIILRPKEKYCMNFNTQALGIHLPGRTPGTCSPGLCYRTPQGAATPALRQAAPQVAVQLALLLEHAPLGCCPERPQASE
eukprot:scaffold133794_cov17-Tisochrysis_lutea.AAC.1